VLETTALGAAWLAGMRAGLCPGPEEFAGAWKVDRTFAPQMEADARDALYAGWQRAVQATMAF
jgi:glycerol kinase